MATHSSILAWKNPWTEESGGLKSMGLHDWACVHEGGGRWVGSNKLVELKKKRERETKPEEEGKMFLPKWQIGWRDAHLRNESIQTSSVAQSCPTLCDTPGGMIREIQRKYPGKKSWQLSEMATKKVFPSWGSLGWWNMNPKENQLWIFIWRTAAEAEAPIL